MTRLLAIPLLSMLLGCGGDAEPKVLDAGASPTRESADAGAAAPDVMPGGQNASADVGVADTAGRVEGPARCSYLTRDRGSWGLVPAFQGLEDLPYPVGMVRAPGDAEAWYIAGRQGQIWRTHDAAGHEGATLALNITPNVDASGESGLMAIAPPPNFTEIPSIYVSYTRYGGSVMLSRISRFFSSDGGLTFDADSEVVILEFDQTDPARSHANGAMHFGPKDGFLYASFGDGGPDGDPDGYAQNPGSFRGSFVRLDVSDDSPYVVPADNPWAAGGGRPEVWAIGFRNPWQWAFDPKTGELFAGDVGGTQREELDRVEAGKNYGWPVWEGTLCRLDEGCGDAGFEPPVLDYDHREGGAVAGVLPYRGESLPGLDGKILMADFVEGFIWAAARDGSSRTLLVDSERSLVSMATDKGRVYVIDGEAGAILELVAQAPVTNLPSQLSATGCVDPDHPKVAAAHLVGYGVASEPWADEATRARFISVPEGTLGTWTEGGRLALPVGSAVIESFDRGGVRLETRLLFRHTDGWGAYTYAWDETQADATLVAAGSVAEVHLIGEERWAFPTRHQCATCHTRATFETLGLNAWQLNWGKTEGGTQVEAMFAAGLTDQAPDGLPKAAPNYHDASAPLPDRARSYLYGNCAHCHRPKGPGITGLDLRYEVATAATGLCGATRNADEGLIVTAGDPDASALIGRLSVTGAGRMPPFGSVWDDADGIALLRSWISSMDGCAAERSQ